MATIVAKAPLQKARALYAKSYSSYSAALDRLRSDTHPREYPSASEVISAIEELRSAARDISSAEAMARLAEDSSSSKGKRGDATKLLVELGDNKLLVLAKLHGVEKFQRDVTVDPADYSATPVPESMSQYNE